MEEVKTEEIIETEQAEVLVDQTIEVPTDSDQIKAIIEALLFVNGEPLAISRIAEVTGLTEEIITESIEQIKTSLEENSRGVELALIADKYQMRTKSSYGKYIQRLMALKPRKLTPPALETLSIIAYRQPIVKSDVEKIRGVDATPTIKTLLDRKLIKIIGHQATVGQPALYGTTDEFLKIFGLSSLSELPTLRDLGELEADPGEGEEKTEEISEIRNDDQISDAANV